MDIRDEIALKKALYPEWGERLDAADKRIMLDIWTGMKALIKEPTPTPNADGEK